MNNDYVFENTPQLDLDGPPHLIPVHIGEVNMFFLLIFGLKHDLQNSIQCYVTKNSNLHIFVVYCWSAIGSSSKFLTREKGRD